MGINFILSKILDLKKKTYVRSLKVPFTHYQIGHKPAPKCLGNPS
jgi:hypothetical protein